VGLSEGKKKMVAAADNSFSGFTRRTYNPDTGFGSGPVHLCYFLTTDKSTAGFYKKCVICSV